MSYISGSVKFEAGAPKEKIATFAYYYSQSKAELMKKVRDVALFFIFSIVYACSLVVASIHVYAKIHLTTDLAATLLISKAALFYLFANAVLLSLSVYLLYDSYQSIKNML